MASSYFFEIPSFGASSGVTSPLSTFANSPQGIADMLTFAFNTALSVGAIIACIQISRAGWMYMTRADKGGASSSQAKTILQDAIYGLILLFSIWLILNQINPDILNLDIFRSLTDIKSK